MNASNSKETLFGYHEFQGKWTGELLTVDKADGTLTRHVTQIKIEPKGEGWVERRTVADKSGAVMSQHFFTVSGFVNDHATVTCDDELFAGCHAVITQCVRGTTTLTLSRIESGLPFLIETCTQVSPTHRVRTLQNFDSVGEFVSISVVEENKVM